MTIVAINKGTEGYTQQFSVSSDSQITDIDRYRTSITENIAKTENLAYTDNSFWAQLPAESVSTFVVTLSEKAIEPDENGYYFHDTFEGDTFGWEGHGSSDVLLSGRTPYKGSEALLIQNREDSWNGAQKALNSAFKAGQEYSFSVCAEYLDGDSTENMALTLQYTDYGGNTKYSRIASATAVKGNYVQLANTNFKLPDGGSDFIIYIETESGTNNFYIDEAIGAIAGTKIDGPDPITIVTTTAVTTTPVTSVTTTGSVTEIEGDVNKDGKFNISDLVMMQKWLVRAGNLNDSKAGDLNKDGVINIFDLCIMKRKFF